MKKLVHMNKIDYELKRKEQLSHFAKKKRLLLHSCCAPCSSACLERLKDDFDITVFFYNPNMDTQEEFIKRADEQIRFVKEVYGESVKVVIEKYNSQEYLKTVKGYENEPERGLRCEKCFYLRLNKTAEYAQNNKFDCICTTLSVSPYKNAPLLNAIGEEVCKGKNIEWIYADFKKNNGYLRSIKLSEEYGLYRQNYCGCIFSKR